MRTFGVGVIGCGGVWEHHRVALTRTPRVKCRRVFDLDPERTRKAAAQSGAQAAQSADEILEAPDVDIVAVLTPAVTHADLVEKGADRAKHFMLEKPMATTLADGLRIVNAIKRSGVKCFHPTLRALFSDLFDQFRLLTAPDGLLGPVQCGLYHLVGSPFTWAGWFADRRYCLPEAEYGSHVFDTFLALTGDAPVWVWSHAGRYCREFDQDDVTTVVICFQHGAYFQMNINWVAKPEWRYGPTTYNLVCQRGVIQHNWIGADWYADGGVKGSFQSQRCEAQGRRWEHYEALADAIENGTALSPNERDGLAYVRILEAARQSRVTGRRVELASEDFKCR
ncbi:MAG: Gfo/Idh/MocA family oxidoreductase [Lentisphaerae bacterium]|nr:Gfo/Idh/MocA family oxidoreductase [Lentisphaerota bacterium]